MPSTTMPPKNTNANKDQQQKSATTTGKSTSPAPQRPASAASASSGNNNNSNTDGQQQQQQRQNNNNNNNNNNNRRQGRNFNQRDDPERAAHIEFARNLIEFYFSAENLAFDTYLASCLSSKRLMPIDALVQFPRMKELRITPAIVIEACQRTNKVTLELSRESHAYWIGPTVPGCHPNQATLILRDIPVHVTKEEVFERLNATLLPAGSVLESIAPASKHNGTWFLNFANGESARIALRTLTGKPNMWKPSAMTIIRFKEAASTGYVRSSFAPVPFQTGSNVAPAQNNNNGYAAMAPSPNLYQVQQAYQAATAGEENLLEYQEKNKEQQQQQKKSRSQSRTVSQKRDDFYFGHQPSTMARGRGGSKFSGRGGRQQQAQQQEPRNETRSRSQQNGVNPAAPVFTPNGGGRRSSNASSNGSSNGRKSPLAEAFSTPFPSPETKGKGKTEKQLPQEQKQQQQTRSQSKLANDKKYANITSPPKKIPKAEDMPTLASAAPAPAAASEEKKTADEPPKKAMNFGKLFAEDNNNNNKSKNGESKKSVTVVDEKNQQSSSSSNQQQQQQRSGSNNNTTTANNKSRSTSASRSARQQQQTGSGYRPLGGPHLSLMFGEGTHSYHRDFQQYFKAVSDFGVLPSTVRARLEKQQKEGAQSLPVADAAHASLEGAVAEYQKKNNGTTAAGGDPNRPLNAGEQQLLGQLLGQYQRSLGYQQAQQQLMASNGNNSNGFSTHASSRSSNGNQQQQQAEFDYQTFQPKASNNNNGNNGDSNNGNKRVMNKPNNTNNNNNKSKTASSTDGSFDMASVNSVDAAKK